MSLKKFVVVFSSILFLALASTAWAQGRKGVKAATGPFSYDPALAGSATFLGSTGSPVSTSFQVCAPGGGTIFPAGASSADTSIQVFGVEKVADADGNPLVTPIDLSLDVAPGSLIAGAFGMTPPTYVFTPGYCLDVALSVGNPGVNPADYGDYVVVIKAQSPGSGIGVGSGTRFNLSLRAASLTDNTPPTVSIDSPADASSLILGPISISITATDPAPGSGLGTGAVSASIKSAGNTVNEPLTLADNGPQPAGSALTATGSYTPTGGTGTAGTTSGTAFSSGSRSGIGTYTITASATDLASNTSADVTSTFQVKYDVEFSTQTGQINTGNPSNSNGHFIFTADRSSVTSDGAFMYDNTVKVELHKASDNSLVATHTLGAGVQANVVYSGASYETKFLRGDIGATASDSYYVLVFFMDVDGNYAQQAKSSNVTF